MTTSTWWQPNWWQAFLNTLWILAPPILIPPSPLDWLCTEAPTEPLLEQPARAVQLDEALAELMPLPDLTDATQSFLLTTDPPIDVIIFV